MFCFSLFLIDHLTLFSNDENRFSIVTSLRMVHCVKRSSEKLYSNSFSNKSSIPLNGLVINTADKISLYFTKELKF